jgi:hypothetical protein
MDFDRISKWVDLLIRAEVHAFALVLIGAALYLHGAKEPGSASLAAGLAVFKGRQ